MLQTTLKKLMIVKYPTFFHPLYSSLRILEESIGINSFYKGAKRTVLAPNISNVTLKGKITFPHHIILYTEYCKTVGSILRTYIDFICHEPD